MERVLLGFSGGVDSAASAIELMREGYDVCLLMLDTVGDAGQIRKARDVAEKLGLELNVADVRRLFRRSVVDYFIDGYCSGETPAPCAVCNEQVKWRTLYEKAAGYGCRRIATGHYFRVVRQNDKYFIRKGTDPVKDQSYFLWALSQQYLAMALTPMGDRLKSDVKQSYSHLIGGSESMGICFLGNKSYGRFLLDNVPSITGGAVHDKYGESVGSHDGCALYTIGQKRGFDCSVPGAVVTGIDADRNVLRVGFDADLYSTVLELDGCMAADLPRLLGSDKITVKIRGLGRNPEGYVRVTDISGKTGGGLSLRAELSAPAWAAAKGQPAVFYEDDIVLGGGYLRNYY